MTKPLLHRVRDALEKSGIDLGDKEKTQILAELDAWLASVPEIEDSNFNASNIKQYGRDILRMAQILLKAIQEK